MRPKKNTCRDSPGIIKSSTTSSEYLWIKKKLFHLLFNTLLKRCLNWTSVHRGILRFMMCLVSCVPHCWEKNQAVNVFVQHEWVSVILFILTCMCRDMTGPVCSITLCLPLKSLSPAVFSILHSGKHTHVLYSHTQVSQPINNPMYLCVCVLVCVCMHACSYMCVCVQPQRNWLVSAQA